MNTCTIKKIQYAPKLHFHPAIYDIMCYVFNFKSNSV